MNWIFSIVMFLLKRLPIYKRYEPSAKRMARRFLDFLRKNPPVSIAIMVALLSCTGVYVFFHPQALPAFIQPGHFCYVIDMSKDAHARNDGDELRLISTRPCSPTKLVAVEFYTWATTRDDVSKSSDDLISGGVLTNGTAIKEPNLTQWYEDGLFGLGNFHPWNIDASLENSNFIFKGYTCDELTLEDRQNGAREENRWGLLLRSTIRSNPKLEEDVKERCNFYAIDPDHHPECKWIRLEVFIPWKAPTDWCGEISLLDKWKSTRTRRIFPAGSRSSSTTLIDLARERPDPTRWQDVPQNQWDQLTEGFPKICMRTVGRNGETLPNGESQWRGFGRVRSVWCDFP